MIARQLLSKKLDYISFYCHFFNYLPPFLHSFNVFLLTLLFYFLPCSYHKYFVFLLVFFTWSVFIVTLSHNHIVLCCYYFVFSILIYLIDSNLIVTVGFKLWLSQ